MTNNVRLAIEVSRYLRRVIRMLFQAGAGVDIDAVLLNEMETGTGLIDEFSPESDEWDWINSVLMLFRTIHGILEAAEAEENNNE